MAIFDDTRADWNARPPTRPRTVVAWSKRLGVSWHWIGPGKGPSAAGSHAKCLEQVRDWQLQHQTRPSDPWKDIGYNALICQHARAIEGRGLEFSGSHSPGVNTVHLGIQFMRGSGTGPPGAAEIARAQRLRADIGKLGVNIKRDWPHCDDPAASTECPGSWLKAWARSSAPRGGTATPAPAPTSFRLGDRGDGVKALQARLNVHGATLTVDGSYGPATETAVRTFQKSAGLSVDGIAGPQTLAALATAPATTTAPTASKEPAMVLVQVKGQKEVYLSTGLVRKHIATPEDLADWQRAIRDQGGLGKVTELASADRLATFGPLDPPAPVATPEV